jgi:hypothetical protein
MLQEENKEKRNKERKRERIEVGRRDEDNERSIRGGKNMKEDSERKVEKN